MMNSSFLLHKRIIVIILGIFLLGVPPLIFAQDSGGGTYKYQCTYNANGDKIKGTSISKIMVIVTCFYGCSATLVQHDDFVGAWYNSGVTYEYSGYNNGWYIYCFHGGMFTGDNYVYIYDDYSKVRVKYAFDRGKYHEYRKYIEGEDIDKGPTW